MIQATLNIFATLAVFGIPSVITVRYTRHYTKESPTQYWHELNLIRLYIIGLAWFFSVGILGFTYIFVIPILLFPLSTGLDPVAGLIAMLVGFGYLYVAALYLFLGIPVLLLNAIIMVINACATSGEKAKGSAET